MLESMNEHLQTIYSGNKYLYAALVLLASTALAITSEALVSIPEVWNKIKAANRRKGSPRW